MTTDMRDPEEIDRDFMVSEMSIPPVPYDARREMLRIIDKCLDLLDRIIDQNGLRS
ncbi:hypothetical protein ACCO44_08135 [Microbacterium maritypicum]|uniref:hypothetical protein n=1 Tax=Microbacterium maritypicum TaxID=33918 RepID=UPI003555C8A3